MLAFDHRELVHRQPVVRLGIVEIDQPRMIARDAAIGALVFHRHAIAQHGVKVRLVCVSDGVPTRSTLRNASSRASSGMVRIEKLNNDQQFIDQYAKSFLGFLASGEDVDPTNIRPRLEQNPRGYMAIQFIPIHNALLDSAGITRVRRRLRFLVWDDTNGKLIGVIALGDAVFNLRARDELVRWNHEQRKDRMANILDAYVLGAVPPYSFLLGGKLVASLIKTKEIVHAFHKKYCESVGIISGQKKNPRLVLVTTTSALGRSSIYNRLKLDNEQFLERIRFTSGWGHFHIPNNLFDMMRSYLAQKRRSLCK